MSAEEHLAELGEAARRAGSIVTEQITSIVDGAERQADRIRGDAEVDAERTRREAVESARRLLQHLHALEQPLGQLVMSLQAEVDRVAGELGSGGYVDSHATAIPPPTVEVSPSPSPEAPEPESADEASEEQVEEARQEEEPPPAAVEQAPAEEPETPAEEPETPAEEPPPPPAPDGESKPRQGLIGRLLRPRSRTFISQQGYCAVCQKAFMAGSEENLKLSGWLVSGDIGLCPDCQSDGWQLPEGARLPFRRGGG